MKIVGGHNFYQERGGEGSVFEDECALLESNGHEVRRPDDPLFGQPLRVFGSHENHVRLDDVSIRYPDSIAPDHDGSIP